MKMASASELAGTALAALTAYDEPDVVEVTRPLLGELAATPEQTIAYLATVLRWAAEQHEHDEDDACIRVDEKARLAAFRQRAESTIDRLLPLLRDAARGDTSDASGADDVTLRTAGASVAVEIVALLSADSTCALEPHVPANPGLSAVGYVAAVLHAARCGLEVAAIEVHETPTDLLTALGLHTAQMADDIDLMGRRRRSMVFLSTPPADAFVRALQIRADCAVDPVGAPLDTLRRRVVETIGASPVQTATAMVHLCVSVVGEWADEHDVPTADAVDMVWDLFPPDVDAIESGRVGLADILEALRDADAHDTAGEYALAVIAQDDPVDVVLLLGLALQLLVTHAVDDPPDIVLADLVAHADRHRALLGTGLGVIDPATVRTLQAVEAAVSAGTYPDAALLDDAVDVFFDAVLVYLHQARRALEDAPEGPDAAAVDPADGTLSTALRARCASAAAMLLPAWEGRFPSVDALEAAHLRMAQRVVAFAQLELTNSDAGEGFVGECGEFIEYGPYDALRLLRDHVRHVVIPAVREVGGDVDWDELMRAVVAGP
jgi:hypothetical protein